MLSVFTDVRVWMTLSGYKYGWALIIMDNHGTRNLVWFCWVYSGNWQLNLSGDRIRISRLFDPYSPTGCMSSGWTISPSDLMIMAWLYEVPQVPEPSTVSVVHFPRGSLADLRFFSSFTNEVVVVILDLWMVFLGRGSKQKILGPNGGLKSGMIPHEGVFTTFFSPQRI